MKSKAGDVASSAADTAKEKVEDAVEAAKHKAQRETSIAARPLTAPEKQNASRICSGRRSRGWKPLVRHQGLEPRTR